MIDREDLDRSALAIGAAAPHGLALILLGLVGAAVIALAAGCGGHDPKRPQVAQRTQAALAAHVAAQPDWVIPSRSGWWRWAVYVDPAIPRTDRIPYRDPLRARALFGNAPSYQASRSSRDAALEALHLWLGSWEFSQRLAPLPLSDVAAIEWHWYLGNAMPYVRSAREKEIRLDLGPHGVSWGDPIAGAARLIVSGIASDGLWLDLGEPDCWGWIGRAATGRGPVLQGQAVYDEAFALVEVRAWQ